MLIPPEVVIETIAGLVGAISILLAFFQTIINEKRQDLAEREQQRTEFVSDQFNTHVQDLIDLIDTARLHFLTTLDPRIISEMNGLVYQLNDVLDELDEIQNVVRRTTSLLKQIRDRMLVFVLGVWGMLIFYLLGAYNVFDVNSSYFTIGNVFLGYTILIYSVLPTLRRIRRYRDMGKLLTARNLD